MENASTIAIPHKQVQTGVGFIYLLGILYITDRPIVK